MAKEKYQLLQIDAWAGDEEGTWDWNNWYKLKMVDHVPESVEDFFDLLEGDKRKMKDYDIEDDQYNIVLVRKSDRMPLFAVEYGSQHY